MEYILGRWKLENKCLAHRSSETVHISSSESSLREDRPKQASTLPHQVLHISTIESPIFLLQVIPKSSTIVLFFPNSEAFNHYCYLSNKRPSVSAFEAKQQHGFRAPSTTTQHHGHRRPQAPCQPLLWLLLQGGTVRPPRLLWLVREYGLSIDTRYKDYLESAIPRAHSSYHQHNPHLFASASTSSSTSTSTSRLSTLSSNITNTA